MWDNYICVKFVFHVKKRIVAANRKRGLYIMFGYAIVALEFAIVVVVCKDIR